MVCKYFLPFHRLPFTLLIVSFAVQRLLNICQYFVFCFPVLLGHIQTMIAQKIGLFYVLLSVGLVDIKV